MSSTDFPFNGQPPPAGVVMKRYQYDVDNDGIVDEARHAITADSAGSFTAQTNVRIDTVNGNLQLRNPDNNTWHNVWVIGAAGEEGLFVSAPV